MQDLGSNPTMAKAGQVWPPSPLVHICISHCLQLPPSQICCLAPQIWYAGRICTEAAPELAIPEHSPHVFKRTLCGIVCAKNSAGGVRLPWLTHIRCPVISVIINPESWVIPWINYPQVCQRVGFRSSMDISIGSPGRLVPLKVIGSLIRRLIPHIGNSSICAFQDNDANVKNAKWDWFNARNYCRWNSNQHSAEVSYITSAFS